MSIFNTPKNVGYSAGLDGMPKEIPHDYSSTEEVEYEEGYAEGSLERSVSVTDPIPNELELRLSYFNYS